MFFCFFIFVIIFFCLCFFYFVCLFVFVCVCVFYFVVDSGNASEIDRHRGPRFWLMAENS